MASYPRRAGLILAAGKGTRMRSSRPKVMGALLGEPMLQYVINALSPIFGDDYYIVAGYGKDELKKIWPDAKFIEQDRQLGTGHALLCALPVLNSIGADFIFVINGDTPLISSSIIEDFLKRADAADIAFATLTLDDPASFGRVVRRGESEVLIIEAKDYDTSVYGEPTGEINAGMYQFSLNALNSLLPTLKNDNKSGEYYLTDLIRLGQINGLSVSPVPCGSDPALLGVNSPAELSAAETLARENINSGLLARGVLLHSPSLVSIGPTVVIEPGAEISGPCEIYGNSLIESDAVIESFCKIQDSAVRSFARIRSFSHLEGAEVKREAIVGPYARLRPAAEVCERAHVGNFVELKKTRLGKGAKANHLAYLGDSDIGANVNIGAGTITCNYDGKNKFKTQIGEGAFIGSNSSLVAPVTIGENSVVGAGSVITKPVPPDSLAIERNRQKSLPRKKS